MIRCRLANDYRGAVRLESVLSFIPIFAGDLGV